MFMSCPVIHQRRNNSFLRSMRGRAEGPVETVQTNEIIVLYRGCDRLACSGRDGDTLASVFCSFSLHSFNLSWNNLRASGHSKKRRAADKVGSALASAALVHPGRLVSLELSFNGLGDAFGVCTSGLVPCTRMPGYDTKKLTTKSGASVDIGGGRQRSCPVRYSNRLGEPTS